jgi:hypothetical protein
MNLIDELIAVIERIEAESPDRKLFRFHPDSRTYPLFRKPARIEHQPS